MDEELAAQIKTEVDAVIANFESKLKAIQEKYVPVSEERLNKLWGAVRGTLDDYTAKINSYQQGITMQNEKIATLTAQMQQLQQTQALHAVAVEEAKQTKRLVEQVLTDGKR